VTSKKRQDLRIQLQKRARRRAEKKVEYLEDDKNWKAVSHSMPQCRVFYSGRGDEAECLVNEKDRCGQSSTET